MPAHKKPRIQKNCKVCGASFECTPSKATKQATCLSEECKQVIRAKNGKYNPFYGRNHSEESKAKVSKTKTLPRKEIECTCGCGEKIELPPYKIRNSKTNVFFVNQSHMFQWLEGENHWNYRGGNVFYGDGWAKIAQSVRERDKVCQHCGKTPEQNGRALDVHHINPVRVSRDNSMDNLIALCMSCHHRINITEQYVHPHKLGRYRKCIACDKIFVPKSFQKLCSDECRRKKTRQWEKNYLDNHPEAYVKRRQRITKWQQTNKDKVNASHQKSRQRRRDRQPQQSSDLLDQMD